MRSLYLLTLLAACDGPSSSPADAPTAVPDAPIPDGPPPMETADPAEPVTTASCAGTFGYPALPTIHATESLLETLAGDVDGDGHLDSVVVGFSFIHVSLGVGDGTFAPAPGFMIQSPSIGLVRAADITGDGKADLVMSDVFDGALTIARSTGAGFDTSMTVPLALLPFDMTVADVDGNGRPDILAVTTEGTLAVLLDDGPGFHAAATYDAGTFNTVRLAVADLTGDGRGDVIASNLTANTVSVLPNLGAGTFGPRVTYPVPAPYGIGAANLDGDADVDVVVATRGPGDEHFVSILLNQGDGVLAPPADVPAGPNGTYYHRILATGDLDADGHADVVVSDAFGSESLGATVFYGTGDGTLAGARSVAPDMYTLGMAVGDVTSDGRADVMLQVTNELVVFESTGTAERFAERARQTFERPFESTSTVRIADFDGNGALDALGLFNIAPTYEAVRMMGDGAGQFGAPAVDAVPMNIDFSEVADLNNDGRTDVIVLGREDDAPAARVLLADPSGALQSSPLLSGPATLTELEILDVDEDGLRDLLTIEDGDAGDWVRLYRNLGGGTFAPAVDVTPVLVPGQGGSQAGASLALLDLDGDGHRDMVLETFALSTELHLATLRGNGDGTFQAPIAIEVQDIGIVSAHDMDADGRLDIVEVGPSFIAVRRNPGTGTLGPRTVTVTPPLETDAAFADFDGDGHLDLVRGAYNAVAIFRGLGDGTFAPPVFYESGTVHLRTPPRVGDMDHDGRVDIIVGNGGDRFSILYGRCR